MANTVASPYMSLPVPVVGQESGPQWSIDINACMAIIDAHNHTSGNGQPITPSGLNINADLTIANNNVTALRSLRFQVQAAPLALAADIGCLYESGVDLYYNDGSGNQVRITQSGAVAGTPGSIASLASPASATYVSANSTFVWQSAASTPANMDGASVILRNLTASSKGLTLAPPAAMGADYTITLPALPGATNLMTLDSSGNIGAAVNVDNSSLQLSANVLAIKAQGVTAAMILNAAITGTQVSSNINLPGNTVQVNGKNVIASATNTTKGLQIIRGEVDGAGNIVSGEGFTAGYVSVGVVQITFTNGFGDLPAVIGNCAQNVGVFDPNTITTNTFSARRYNSATQAAADYTFTFIAVGQRA